MTTDPELDDFFDKFRVTKGGNVFRKSGTPDMEFESIGKFLVFKAAEKLYEQTEDAIRAKAFKILRERFGVGKIKIYFDDGIVDRFLKWTERNPDVSVVNSKTPHADKKLFSWYNHETEVRTYSLQDADGTGSVFFEYKNAKFAVCSTSSEPPDGQGSYRQLTKSYYLQTDIKNSNLLNELIEGFKNSSTKSPPSIRIHSEWGSWTSLPSAPRPMESVVLPEGETERLLEDIQEFFNSENEYYQKGLLWKRGYMLTGPPGGGKTSLIRAVATQFNLDIYHIMSSSLESDITLARLMTDIPNRSLIVFEDLDAVEIAKVRDEQNSTAKDKLTTSGLLNVIDGMFSPEGSLIFITSNHPEKLDSALTRPGRIDYWLDLGTLDQAQFNGLVKLHYPEYQNDIFLDHDTQIMAADVISIVKTMQDFDVIKPELKTLAKSGDLTFDSATQPVVSKIDPMNVKARKYLNLDDRHRNKL